MGRGKGVEEEGEGGNDQGMTGKREINHAMSLAISDRNIAITKNAFFRMGVGRQISQLRD